jgi:hypothetical protein
VLPQLEQPEHLKNAQELTIVDHPHITTNHRILGVDITHVQRKILSTISSDASYRTKHVHMVARGAGGGKRIFIEELRHSMFANEPIVPVAITMSQGTAYSYDEFTVSGYAWYGPAARSCALSEQLELHCPQLPF